MHIKAQNYWGVVMLSLISSTFLILFPISASAEEAYTFGRMWPTLQQSWYFLGPNDVAVDNKDNVYVVVSNARVKKFTSQGQFISELGAPQHARITIDERGYYYVCGGEYDSGGALLNPRVEKYTLDGEFVLRWGSQGNGNGEFSNPVGLAIDSNSNVYVVDALNHRIQKFTSEGQFITKWGSQGSGAGQFDEPFGIAVNKRDKVLVVDKNNHCIQTFSSNGQFISKWGSEGSDDGQFLYPHGIAVDDEGNVYVSEGGNHRIQKFTSEGIFITQWGESGRGDGQFSEPIGMALDANGNLFVADLGSNRVQKFSSDGRYLNQWGSGGISNGRFYEPTGIEVDDSGYIYVADSENNRIQKFGPNGQFISSWGQYGNGNSEFHMPYDIAIDSKMFIYVTDTQNARIQKFTTDGQFVTTFDSFDPCKGIFVDVNENMFLTGTDRVIKLDSEGKLINEWGEKGTGDGQFDFPIGGGIAVDSNGYIYVADSNNGRIQVFSSAGEFVTKWITGGYPQGIDIDAEDYIYVALPGQGVLRFNPEGQLITKIGRYGYGPGHMSYTSGVAVDHKGAVYVTDTGGGNTVQVFQRTELPSNAKTIIIAGGGPYPGNDLWDATQMCANFAYRTLTYQGFTKETIYYLSSNTDLDLDNNGVADDVDGDAINSNLQRAITTWAKDADSLVLYLVDHGGNNTFRMSGTETLSASDLDTWLDTLQTTMPGRVIVVYDACESGSFLPSLTPPAGKERIVLTSTSSDQAANFVTQGSISFSNYFWTHIFNGISIKDAFDLTNEALGVSFNDQHPLVDADGNGVGNEPADFSLIEGLYIGSGTEIQGDAPVIGGVSSAQTVTETASALLSASGVTDDDGIARVWAVIRPPDYSQGSSDNPVTELPSVDLMPAGGGQYEGVYDSFNIQGPYQIAIYARDRIGNTSIPKLTTVSVQSPLRRKAIIVVGCSQSDTWWPVVKESASLAYKALTYQGYTDNDIYFMSPVAFSTGYDVSSTLSNLSYAINTWCMEDTQDVVLYMVGNGDEESFQVNDTESVSATDLDSWLDALQESIPGKVTIIYDARLSGSFLPLLSPAPNKERISISSASSSESAHFLSEGNICFSKYFWSRVSNGANVNDAFLHGKNAMVFLEDGQVPQLDDTGNGVGNEKADGWLARNYTIGIGIMLAGDDPVVGSVSPEQTLSGEISATIWAKEVTSTGTIDKIWAVITPPNYTGGSSANPITDLPTIDLISLGNNQYEGTSSNFTLSGSYNIAVFAMDAKGTLSLPVQTSVTVAGANGCLFVTADLNILVPCAAYDGNQYGFTLDFYNNPDDPTGYYWNLDMATLAGGTGTDCIPVGNDLSIPIPCAAYSGTQYGFILRYYNIIDDPSGMYWKIDMSTLEMK